MLKAIETVYHGYRFRSRLEARWAVFFDSLGVPYEYEKEGFDLDGDWYLPDFWLPEQDCWVEIKGDSRPENDAVPVDWQTFLRGGSLAQNSGKMVVIATGECHPNQRRLAFLPNNENNHPPYDLIFRFCRFDLFTSDRLDPERDTCPVHGPSGIVADVLIDKTRKFAVWMSEDRKRVFGIMPDICYNSPVTFVRDTESGRIWLGPSPLIWNLPTGFGDGETDDSDFFRTAYTAARQARFEHGEKGRRR